MCTVAAAELISPSSPPVCPPSFPPLPSSFPPSSPSLLTFQLGYAVPAKTPTQPEPEPCPLPPPPPLPQPHSTHKAIKVKPKRRSTSDPALASQPHPLIGATPPMVMLCYVLHCSTDTSVLEYHSQLFPPPPPSLLFSPSLSFPLCVL